MDKHNIVSTKEEREKIIKMAQDGYTIDKVCAKFPKLPRITILRTVRVMGIKWAIPIKYCKECGHLIERDETKGGKKIYCGSRCARAVELKRLKIWLKENRKKRGYDGLLKENRIKNKRLPSWACPNDCGFKIKLDFDPRANFTSKKILALKCPNCHE